MQRFNNPSQRPRAPLYGIGDDGMSVVTIGHQGADLESLRDEVSVIAYAAAVQELGTNVWHLTDEQRISASKFVANVAHEFADAFMRERYERMCIKATGINLQDLEKK